MNLLKYISTFGGREADLAEELMAVATIDQFFDFVDQATEDLDEETIVEILEFFVHANKPNTGWRW